MLILLPMPIQTFCDYDSNSDSNRPGFDSNSQVETGIHTSLAEKQSKWKIGFASFLGIKQFFSQSLSIAYFAERARLTKPQQSYCRSYTYQLTTIGQNCKRTSSIAITHQGLINTSTF